MKATGVLCFATQFLAWVSVCADGWQQIDKMENKIRERRPPILGNSMLSVTLGGRNVSGLTPEQRPGKARAQERLQRSVTATVSAKMRREEGCS